MQDDPLWGDKIEVWAKRWGLDKAAEAFTKATGVPCGCASRKGFLNWLDTGRKKIFGHSSPTA